MTHTTLIGPEQLASILADPLLVVVDCRFDLADTAAGERAYEHAHIPGAVYAHLDRDLSGAKTGSNGRHPLPATDALIKTFGRLGIGDDVRVVAYDQDTGMYASRLWWLLRWMGHEAVAVLDGGFARWIAAHHSTSAGVETPRGAHLRRCTARTDDGHRRGGRCALRVTRMASRRREGARALSRGCRAARSGGRTHTGRREPFLPAQSRRMVGSARRRSCAQDFTKRSETRAATTWSATADRV